MAQLELTLIAADRLDAAAAALKDAPEAPFLTSLSRRIRAAHKAEMNTLATSCRDQAYQLHQLAATLEAGDTVRADMESTAFQLEVTADIITAVVEEAKPIAADGAADTATADGGLIP